MSDFQKTKEAKELLLRDQDRVKKIEYDDTLVGEQNVDLKNTIKGNHIYQSDFVDLDKILPRCSFIICQGGNGTIYEALKHKKFILCLTSHFEQEWNVQRLSALKLGIMINDEPIDHINKKIEDVLAKWK